MYRVSFLAMHEWMSDRKYQSATSDLGVEIAHGGGARSCSSASRDSLRTQVSEDTNKLCDAVSLSLGLHSEPDTYDAEQPPSRRESAPGEDGFAHASRELPEAGKRAHSPCFRTQVEGRRPGPPSGWFESFQRKRDDHPLRMSYLQLKDAADAESSKEFHRNRGLPPNHSVSVHCRSLDESDAPFSQSEEIMQTSIRQPNAVENAVDQWPKNAFAQTSGTFKTDLEYPCPSRASLCWDGAGRTAAQPSRHCHVPSMNYSPYDLFLRNCSDYSLCSPPLSFNGQYPESYYPGGIYGRIPATAALPRPCEWTSGRSSLSPGFRLEDMMPMSLLLAAPRVCQICGDVASGCHYGALTCGSCKVFFKRAAEGKQNFLCASRNDCTIDKLRRKNCPSCRLKRCFESGMTLRSRKLKVIDSQKPLERSDSSGPSAVETAPSGSAAPAMVPAHLLETLHSVLGHIEPLMVHAGHDAAQPDSATALLTSLNQLGERQLVSVVKWAKGVPGFRNLHVDDQMMAIQYSWMVIMVFGLGWRSFTEANATHLFFAPDLVFNEQRMHASGMYEDCVRLRQLSQRFSALRVSREEFLCMKALLLFSFIPAEGLKSQSCFDELRSTYINELGRLVTTREHGNRNERLFQLTQLLDYLQLIVQKLHQFTYDLYLQTLMLQTKVNFPEMISEIISVHVPKILRGLVKPILFHK